jgi:hypothetical protein
LNVEEVVKILLIVLLALILCWAIVVVVDAITGSV